MMVKNKTLKRGELIEHSGYREGRNGGGEEGMDTLLHSVHRPPARGGKGEKKIPRAATHSAAKR